MGHCPPPLGFGFLGILLGFLTFLLREVALLDEARGITADQGRHKNQGGDADEDQRGRGGSATCPFARAFPTGNRTGQDRLTAEVTAQVVGKCLGAWVALMRCLA